MMRMLNNKKRRFGQGALEGIILLTFVLTGFFIFQKYILRGMSSRWKVAGDSFGSGRQFDPNRTLECAYIENQNREVRIWYSNDCMKENCLEECYSMFQLGSDECNLCLRTSACNIVECQPENTQFK